MKGLYQFLHFNWEDFARDKTFVVIKTSDDIDYQSKMKIGKRIECVISTDRTQYNFKNGSEFSNRFEKITFKTSKEVNIPLESQVVPKGVVAHVYGDYMNQLSVKCDDIVIVPTQTKAVSSAQAPIRIKQEM